MIFSYLQYEAFLSHLKSCARVVPFKQWDGTLSAILRHDVDFDITPAYYLAMIEHRYGISSTYFIRVACETYNPASAKNKKMLQEMCAYGFEIGLHFDPTLYGDSRGKDLQWHVENEAGFLTSIINETVSSVSLHNPSIHNEYPLFEGYTNAYAPEIFSDEYYLSDSCMNFRGKDPFRFAEKAITHPIQILLHPMHFSEHGRGYPEAVMKYMKSMAKTIDEGFRVNPA